MKLAWRNVRAIVRRELSSFFSQPVAWVFLAAFLVVAALVGLRGFFERNVADLRDYFDGLRYAFVLLAPAAAMRLWAEERRAGTIELLLTLPIQPWQAVLGKFLAGLVVLALALVAGSILPLSLAPFGSFDAGQIAAGYLGAFLLAGTFLSIGLLASALTRGQEVAFLVAALACLLLNVVGDPFLVQKAGEVLPRRGVEAVAGFAVAPHYESLTRGLLETRSLAYFVGISAAALFVNVLLVERRPRSPREPLLALGLALLALVLWVDLSGQRAVSARFDLSSRDVNSLSPATQDVLDKIQGRVVARVYLSEKIPLTAQPHVRRLRDLLDDLVAYAGEERLAVELVDPDTSELRKQAERQGVTKFTLQVQQADGGAVFREVYAGVVFFYGARPPSAIPVALDTSLNLEYEAALAIRRVLLPRRVVGIAGRGTKQGFKQVKQALKRLYSLRELDLTKLKQVPEAVSLVVYAAPITPSRREVYVLDQFVARGGRLILLAEGHAKSRQAWEMKPLPGDALGRALESWGLALGPGLLFQIAWRRWPLRMGRGQVLAAYPWFIGPTGKTSPKSPVAGGLGRIVFPWASQVRAVGSMPAGGDRVALVTTEPAWSLSGPQNTHPARKVQVRRSERRPHVVAAAVRGKLKSAWAGGPGENMLPAAGGGEDPLAIPLQAATAEGRVALFGDVDFLRDAWVGQEGGNAIPLLLNTVGWCLDDGSLASVRARASAQPLSGMEEKVLGLAPDKLVWGLNVFALPFLILFLGFGRLFVVRRRRARKASALRASLAGEAP